MTIIKFYADWCAPCKKLSDMLSEIGADVVSVNVEDEAELATQYKVRSLPTMVKIGPDGAEVGRLVGMPANTHSLKEFVA